MRNQLEDLVFAILLCHNPVWSIFVSIAVVPWWFLFAGCGFALSLSPPPSLFAATYILCLIATILIPQYLRRSISCPYLRNTIYSIETPMCLSGPRNHLAVSDVIYPCRWSSFPRHHTSNGPFSPYTHQHIVSKPPTYKYRDRPEGTKSRAACISVTSRFNLCTTISSQSPTSICMNNRN